MNRLVNPSAMRPTPTVSLAVSLALIAATAFLRLGLWSNLVLPIGFGVPIVLIAYLRNRAWLWGAVAVFTAVEIFKMCHLTPSSRIGADQTAFNYRWAAILVEVDLLLVAMMAHIWIVLQEQAEARTQQLEAANMEAATREEEIARQNEELQSQTEELERQSEELRATNEQLERRERTLEVLLSLSRSLATELSRGDMMARICQTIGLLVDGPATAAAVLEQQGDVLEVVCHHGFGPEGVRESKIPIHQSFAALVLSRGRTGYLDDIRLRPDLKLPQPSEGEPLISVLAVPLRVGGWPIGTLEAYSRSKTAWTDEQVVLLESLAAQTSISLEASRLFETLQRERQRLETVLRTVPLSLVIANADCSDVRVNPAGGRLFQVSSEENVAGEIGRGSWRLFRDGREIVPHEFPVRRAARDGIETLQEEFEQLTVDGRRLVLLCNARPIRGAGDEILGAVAAMTDITPQKELQRELDARRREAEEASVRKTRFLAAVSHDVRTPANAISLLAELLRRSASSPAMVNEVPDLAQELQASSVSLVNLLTDVLDIARFDSGKVELQESEFSLGQLLEEERRRLAPVARQKNLSYIWVLPPEPIWLRTDKIKLSRVLSNLVGNAIKFTERGEVRVETARTSEGGVAISVRDTGVGIAPEDQGHIFDEFLQLQNPERDRAKGSGLGLSICHRLVEAMGATITLHSSLGAGSTFTVVLPAACVVVRPLASSDHSPTSLRAE